MNWSYFVFCRCTLWLLPLLLTVCVPAYSYPPLSDAEFARLCALTTESVTEITRAREIAEKAGYRLATYGGTSREIAVFVRKKIAELGGAAEFEKWIGSTDRLHLLDWHHIQSDLDLLLIPNLGGKADEGEMAAVAKQIEQSLPGNIFFKETDVRVASSFFREHPPGNEHFEAISNVAFGREGMESVGQLTVDVNGQKRSLSEWGLSQLNRGHLEFEVNRQHQSTADAYGSMRQFLRWLRYTSELPGFELTPASRKEVIDYFEWLKKEHGNSIRALLQKGDRSFLNKSKADSIDEKLIEALEKLQLYSPDPYKTNQWMDDVGLTSFLEEAGVATRRQLKPLARLGVPPTPKGAGAAQPKILRHRTTLAAAQNIGLGAMWASNNETIIGGKPTTAVMGTGLYAAEAFQSVGYGDMYVELELHPHARRGIDYVESGGYYTIINRDAIVSVRPLTLESLRKNFEAQLSAPETTTADKRSLLRGLASLYYPESHPEEWADFQKTLQWAAAQKLESSFISAYLKRPGSVEYLTALPLDSEIRRFLNEYLSNNPTLALSLTAENRGSDRNTWDQVKELLKDPRKEIDSLTGIMIAMSARSEDRRRQDAVPDYGSHSYSFWDEDRIDTREQDSLRAERFKKQRVVSDEFWHEYLAAIKKRANGGQHLPLLLVMPQRAWEPHIVPLLDQPNSLHLWKAISEIPNVEFNENIWAKLRSSWKGADPELRQYLAELVQARPDWDKPMGEWSQQTWRGLPSGISFPALAVAAARNLKNKIYLTATEIAEAKSLLEMAGESASKVAKTLSEQANIRADQWEIDRAFALNGNHFNPEGRRDLITRDWTAETKQIVLDWLRSADPALQTLALSVLSNRPNLSPEEWRAMGRISDSIPPDTEDGWSDRRSDLLSTLATRFVPEAEDWTPEVWRLQSRFVHQGHGFLPRVRDVKPSWQESSWTTIIGNLKRDREISSYQLELAWKVATSRDEKVPAELWKMIIEQKSWGIISTEKNWPREAWIGALAELSQLIEKLDDLNWRKKYFDGEDLKFLLETLLNRADLPQELWAWLEHPFIRERFLKGSLGSGARRDISPELKARYEAALAERGQKGVAQFDSLQSRRHANPSEPVVMEQQLAAPRRTISYRCRIAYLTLTKRKKK